jgi:hypothetical protein
MLILRFTKITSTLACHDSATDPINTRSEDPADVNLHQPTAPPVRGLAKARGSAVAKTNVAREIDQLLNPLREFVPELRTQPIAPHDAGVGALRGEP